MSLQTRTTAPGKARRAAKGKPRHTTAQKAARKATVAKPAARGSVKRSAPIKEAAKAAVTTTRYSDREVVSKKEVRVADRSKLRAQRFQERTASKSKDIEGAPKGNPKQSREELTFSKSAKPFKRSGERPATKPQTRAAKFVAERTERAERPFRPTHSDTRPTTRREVVKAKIARTDDGRPNFIPQKREKYNPSAPQSVSQRRGDSPRISTAKPARDRRNNSSNE